MENYKVYVPTNKESTKIKFSLNYLKPSESYSWATGERRETGYRVTATPVVVGKGSECFTAFSGFSDILLPCERRSNKRKEEAINILKSKIESIYLNWFEERGYVIDPEWKKDLEKLK